MKDISLEKTIPIKVMLFNSPGTRIEIKQFKVSFNMVTLMQEDQEHIHAELNQNISYSKVQFFLQEILNESVFCEKAHSEQVMQYLGSYENNLVVLPDLDKGAIITALHRKLNSICTDNTQIFVVKLCDVDMDLTYTYTCMDLEDREFDGLPSNEEWMGEFSYWDKPWWDRDDQLTWDRSAQNIEEWMERREKNFDGTDIDPCAAFDEIESQMIDLFQEAMVQAGLAEPKEGEIIEVDFENKKTKERWKPTLV